MNLMTKPITPMTRIPSRQILIDSQSSLLPGFLASLSNLLHDLRNDLNPKFVPTQVMPILSEIHGTIYLNVSLRLLLLFRFFVWIVQYCPRFGLVGPYPRL